MNDKDMTAIQMNAELLRNMSIIAEDQYLLNRAARYIRKLVKEKSQDDACMTKEEFFARVDEASKGASRSFANVKELDQYIRSL